MDCQSLVGPPKNTTTGFTGLRQSPDGTIRLTQADLHSVALQHLLSGLDENIAREKAQHAMSTSLTGYTEWLSPESPVISLGWDWQLDVTGTSLQLRRVGEPRSNLMFTDAYLRDLGDAHSSALLAGFVDQFNWQGTVLHAIEMRYQK